MIVRNKDQEIEIKLIFYLCYQVQVLSNEIILEDHMDRSLVCRTKSVTACCLSRCRISTEMNLIPNVQSQKFTKFIKTYQ